MPSETKHEIIVKDDIACLCISSNDPRRNGRIDAVLFDSEFVPLISQFTKWKGNGFDFYNENGDHIGSILSSCIGMHTRIVENDDYTRKNYTKREITKDLYVFRKLSHEEAISENYPRIKWKSKAEIVELPVKLQNNDVITIKINAFLAHLVPKLGYYNQSNCPSGVCFRAKKDPYKGPSLAKTVMEYLDRPCSGRAIARDDIYNYVVDPNDSLFEATLNNKNIYHLCGDVAVLEIRINNSNISWYATNIPYRYPSNINLNSEKKVVFIAFDSSALHKVKELECDWSYVLDNSSNLEVKAFYSQTTMITLKKLLAGCYGIDVGPRILPSRYSKYYQKAIDSDNYHVRAKFENASNNEKTGGRVMFTKSVSRNYCTIKADKHVFIPDLYEGIGAWCLDMRKDSLRIGGATG